MTKSHCPIHVYVILTGILCLLTLPGCTSNEQIQLADSSEYPYVLEPVRTINREYHPIDLDGDGRDELAALKQSGIDFTNGQGGGVDFKTQDRYSIAAFNVGGVTHKLLFFDWNEDGKQDVLVPSVSRDSLFIDVVAVNMISKEAKSIEKVFIAAASEYDRANLTHGWDPFVVNLFRVEGKASNSDELIIVMTSGYAGAPRGLLRFSFPDMELIEKIEIGSPPGYSYLDDVDDDGVEEVVITTSATHNGFSANGLDDSRAYLAVFEIDPLSIAWSAELGHRYAYPGLQPVDTDGNDEFEYIQSVHTNDAGELSRKLRQVDFIEKGFKAEYTFEAPIRRVLNLSKEDGDELLVLDAEGTLYHCEGLFNTVKKVPLDVAIQSPGLEKIPDVDGDGEDEIIVHTGKGFLFLTPDLEAKALYSFTESKPMEGARWGVLQTGVNTLPVMSVLYNGETLIYRMRKNETYRSDQYWAWFTWGMWGLMVLVLSYIGVRQTALKKDLKQDDELKKDHEALRAQVTDYLTYRTINRNDVPLLELIRTTFDAHASDDEFTVEDLADKMGLGKRHAQRKVKHLTGIGPNELLWQYRVHRAAEMLRHAEPDTTIAEIAYDTGFKEAGHMSKRFRKVYGMTPTEYRTLNEENS